MCYLHSNCSLFCPERFDQGCGFCLDTCTKPIYSIRKFYVGFCGLWVKFFLDKDKQEHRNQGWNCSVFRRGANQQSLTCVCDLNSFHFQTDPYSLEAWHVWKVLHGMCCADIPVPALPSSVWQGQGNQFFTPNFNEARVCRIFR